MRTYAGNQANYPLQTGLPDDGDNANAATLDAALKPLADRTAYLKAFKDKVETQGVGRIRTVADRAALEALTGMADGDIVYFPECGLYCYLAGASSAQASVGLPWIVKPTGAIGAWLHTSLGFADQADGLATLDSSRKVPMSRLYADVENGVAVLDSTGKVPKARTYRPAYEIVGVYDVETVGDETASYAGTFYSADSRVDTSALEAGDLIEARWVGRVGREGTTNSWQVKLEVTCAGSIVSKTRSLNRIDLQEVTLFTRRKVVSIGGVHRVQLVCWSGAANAIYIERESHLTVTVLRATTP